MTDPTISHLDQPMPLSGRGNVIEDLINAIETDTEDTLEHWTEATNSSPVAKAFDAVFEAAVLIAEELDLSLVEELSERDRVGFARYGTPLQYGNGRSSMVDLFQELLDGLVYSWQWRGENA